MKKLKNELINKLRDYLKVSILQTGLPLYISDRRLYPSDYIPKTVSEHEVKELNILLSEYKSHNYKVIMVYPVAERSNIIEKYPAIAARTIFGRINPRFICLTNEKSRAIIRADLINKLENYDVDGVVFDFIRFDSPMDGLENFFSCFCEKCIQDMRVRGYNPYKIKEDILRFLKDFSKKANKIIKYLKLVGLSLPDYLYIFVHYKGIYEMIAYRVEVIRELVEELREILKSIKGKKSLFILCPLSPWWSILSGQDYITFSELADVLEPMLYFDWMVWEGTTAVLNLSKLSSIPLNDLVKIYYDAISFGPIEKIMDFHEILHSGLPPESIYYSILKVKELNLGNAKIWPVVMLRKIDHFHRFLNMRITNEKLFNEELACKTGEMLRKAKVDGFIMYSYRKEYERYFKLAVESHLKSNTE